LKTIGGYHLNQSLKKTLFLKRAVKLKKRVKKDTQKLRKKLMNELEKMFKIARKSAKHSENAKEKQHWIRIAAYLSQVLNSIAESFDESKALEYFENLERMVREAKGDSEKGKTT